MKKYKGLNVPELKPKKENIDMIMATYCVKAICKMDCANCLYYLNNLDKFKTWYKSNNK